VKSIFSSPHLYLVIHYKNIVEANGVVCIVKNTFLSGAAGELPPTEVWPSLWVDRSDYLRAEKIVADAIEEFKADGPPWDCEKCGETSPSQFDVCWCCGSVPSKVPE